MTDEGKPKNKGGRPRKFAVDTRNPTLSFRVRAGLYEKLQAESAGVLSLSEVIERRLNDSYGRDEAAADVRTRALGDALVTTLVLEEARTGHPWYASGPSSRFALARITFMLRQLMGVPPIEELDGDDQQQAAREIEAIADGTERDYARPVALGGSVYKAIHDSGALRWLNHRLGQLDYLFWVADRGSYEVESPAEAEQAPEKDIRPKRNHSDKGGQINSTHGNVGQIKKPSGILSKSKL